MSHLPAFFTSVSGALGPVGEHDPHELVLVSLGQLDAAPPQPPAAGFGRVTKK